jgi:hypothetical protein
MTGKPSVVALDVKHDIYALLDESGNTIGTGTEEVCKAFLYLIGKSAPTSPAVRSTPRRMNVRSAISI